MLRRSREFLRRVSGYGEVLQANRVVGRDLIAITGVFGASGTELNYDSKTPRLAILTKSENPILAPQGDSWRSGAVFDGRPINFNGRELMYFCAQPAYRTDRHLFVGMGEMHGDEISVLDKPVIVPDIETRGIDIPAYTVWNNQVVGLYADDYGPLRTGRGTDCDFIVVTSSDGINFKKKKITKPFADIPFSKIGLPWLLTQADNTISVYMRAKRGNKTFLTHSILDVSEGTISKPAVAATFTRNPINIAVTKRSNGYILFYGATVGGGPYVVVSSDRENFEFSNERMLVGNDEWGWDYYKVCPSPCNGDGLVRFSYTGGLKGLSLGLATFDPNNLA